MSDTESLSLSMAAHIHQVCNRFEDAFRAGAAPRIEDYLEKSGGDRAPHPALLRALMDVELELRRARGEEPRGEEYVARFPEHAPLIAAAFADAPTRSEKASGEKAIGRSLLFGILALQNNFIGRDSLLAAFNTWVVDKSQSFGAILTGQGLVSPERYSLLKALVGEHLRQHGGDPEASVAAISAAIPEYDCLFTINDPDVQRSLGPFRGERSAGGASDAPTGSWSGLRRVTPGGGRFRILRAYKEGGMGKVSVASDQELNREVALKEIRPSVADDPFMRERFVVEAEITGGLEHPAIVPVYGLGHYENGRPFYAMRLIKDDARPDWDDTLRGAIKRFHAAEVPGRDPAERSLALRELLGRFLDICDAITYAHHRGILHRDLKPGNVILGRYGETFVLDWGLAGVFPRVEGPDEQAEPTLRPASAGDTWHTWTGSAVGTIGYMPPEQAAGQLDQLGPASDVYGLGAILYVLLTGQASIKRTASATAEERAREEAKALGDTVAGNFPRPRAINRKVSPALEAVCLKAMATKPADRYQSPLALAAEIKHWLADEPVSAYRESRSQRLARWTRRHRAWAQAAAATLFVVTIVSAIAALLVGRFYRSERLAHKQSEADFLTARMAADELYKLASRDLASLANSEGQREQLVGSLVTSYGALLSNRPNDQALRRAAAQTDREEANIRRLLGRDQPALESYNRAVERLKGLLAEFDGDDEAIDGLSLTLSDLGELHRRNGQSALALSTIDEALELARKLQAKSHDELAYMRTEAFALSVLAAAQFDTGGYDEARRSSLQALSLWQTLETSPRNDQLTDPILAIIVQAQVGRATSELGDADGARKAYRLALEKAEARAKANPGNASTLVTLAGVRNGLGEVLLDVDAREAEALFSGSIRDLSRVVQSHRVVTVYRYELASAFNGRGAARLAAKKYATAGEDCKSARERLEALLKEHDLLEGHFELGRTLANLARIARVLGKNEEAADRFNQAIAQHDLVLSANRKRAIDLKHRQRCVDECNALGVKPTTRPGNAEKEPAPAR